MRVAAYFRVSSDEQALKGNSLFEQRERLASYCKAMGWDPPVFYEDDGYSGKDLNRPAMRRMLEDVKLKSFDMVLTTKSDRLCRKLLDLLSLVDYFKRYDCNYTSCTEHFDTSSPTGMLALQILGSFAEFERERIRERVKENHLSLAKQGKMIGKAPYGYNIVEGHYEINIEESLVVKQIFDWFLSGVGARHIAKRLNEMGIPSKNRTRWEEKGVRSLLSLESLTGKFIYNRTYRKGTRKFVRPEEEWIITEDHHDAIIDEDTFNKAQGIFGGRVRNARKYASDDKYLLSGLTYCGHCGSKMHGRTFHDTIFKYVCSEYVKKAGCYFHYVHRDSIEDAVIKYVKHVLYSDHTKLRLIVNNDQKSAGLDQMRLLQEQLVKLDGRMQKQIEAYEKELISDSDLKAARIRIDEERNSIMKSIEQLSKDEERSDSKKVQDRLRNLKDDLFSDDRIRVKSALGQTISKIIIKNGEDIEVQWSN